MCCCGKPTINGQPGFKWQPNDPPRTYPVNPPDLKERDVLLYDEPGRCVKGLDSHCHHYRLVQNYGYTLRVRHGGGDDEVRVSGTAILVNALALLDSDARYLIFNAIYHAHGYGAQEAREKTTQRWRQAAAEKRIKTRKQRGTDAVKVWIEDSQIATA